MLLEGDYCQGGMEGKREERKARREDERGRRARQMNRKRVRSGNVGRKIKI